VLCHKSGGCFVKKSEMNTETTTDKPRVEHWKAAPEAMKAMLALETTVRGLGIDQGLLELIKLRVSQINGCAYCVDMHFNDAKKRGETDQRLNLLPFWQEVTIYSPQERAVLRWLEALTKLPGGHVSDEDFEEIHRFYDDAEITKLTLAIVTINGWNRFGVGFRIPIGYKA